MEETREPFLEQVSFVTAALASAAMTSDRVLFTERAREVRQMILSIGAGQDTSLALQALEGIPYGAPEEETATAMLRLLEEISLLSEGKRSI